MTSLSLRRLGDVVERVTVGHVGPTSDFYVPRGKGVPFLRTQNVGDHAVIRDDIKYVAQEFHQRLGKSTLRAGDLIISRVISNRVRCAVVPMDLDGANCANIVVVRPGAGVDAHYIGYYLTSPVGQRKLLTRQVGSAQTVINTGVIHDWEIPLPSISEQRRIADILDRADSIRRKRKEIIALTEDLLRGIFLEMFGDPISNVRGWITKPLGEIMRIRRGGSPRPIDDYLGGTINWIKIGDATNAEGDLYITSCAEKIIEEGLTKTTFLEPGSFVFANSGVSLGFARILKIPGAIHDGWLAFDEYDKGQLDELFFLKALNGITDHFRQIAPSGTQPNLNTGIMKAFQLILPPIQDQRRFARIVKAVEHQKTIQRAHLAELDSLFASLESRAFKGEL